jgi:glutathione S-transferase
VGDGLTLIESKAIITFLAEKYAKNDALYPTCPCARSMVNQRLWFDSSLYSNYTRYYWPHIFMKTPEDPQMISSTESSFELFDKLLEGMDYVASCHLTVADLVLVTTVSTFEAIGFDISKYPNVMKWYQLVQNTMPGLEVHKAGVDALKATLP